MKSIDFTKPGGFPLTQDQLGYMQTAWQEVVSALMAAGAGGSAPYMLSGMEASISGGVETISAGWFVYNGLAIRFPAQSYTLPTTSADAAYMVITPTAATVAYNDSSTPAVILDSTGAVAVLPATTATDGAHFLLSALAPFGMEAAFTNAEYVVDGPGSSVISGNIAYRKNYLANTLEGYITLTFTDPSAFAGIPIYTIITIATLPVAYRPLRGPVYFSGGTALMVPYAAGSGYFNTLTGFINTDGTLNIFLINSAAGTYGANFSFIVSLN